MHRTVAFISCMVVLAGVAYATTQVSYGHNYAEDRAEVDDLLSRYLFALDWQDAERYGSVFTEDGVLIWAGGTITGRAAIVQEARKMKAADERTNAATPALRPFKRRHFIPNFVLKVDGNRATVRSLWYEFNNDRPDRKPYLGSYGHLEDELRRVDGHWLIQRHQVFNEQRSGMQAGNDNPAW